MKQRAKALHESRGFEPHLRPQLRPEGPQSAPSPPQVARETTAWLRFSLLGATLAGMLSCLPVWTNSRPYPVLPVASWFPVLPAPWDLVLLVTALVSLVAAFRFYRPAVSVFLGAGLLLYLGDQNRGQPAFYLYWVLLALSLAPAPVALAASRFVVSSVYFWGGIQKLNATFFRVVPGWFVNPAENWGFHPMVVDLLRWGITAAPLVEIFIAFALWVPRLRWTAIGLAGAVHLGALLFLGPLGHAHNLVVWPWNLAMLLLVWVLFGRQHPPKWPLTFSHLCASRMATAATCLFCFLPVLSYVGWWDSYFSFALYSGNTATADVYVSKQFQDRLPPSLQPHVHPLVNADSTYQLPFVFDHQGWAMQELGVPPLPEPRAYTTMFKYLGSYAPTESDYHMLINPRAGPILLCRRSGQTPLAIR